MGIDLESREEIRSVLMRLARGTDRRDEELIRSCDHEDGGAWRIAKRVCVWDFAHATSHEPWDLGPTYVKGRNDRDDPSYER